MVGDNIKRPEEFMINTTALMNKIKDGKVRSITTIEKKTDDVVEKHFIIKPETEEGMFDISVYHNGKFGRASIDRADDVAAYVGEIVAKINAGIEGHDIRIEYFDENDIINEKINDIYEYIHGVEYDFHHQLEELKYHLANE